MSRVPLLSVRSYVATALLATLAACGDSPAKPPVAGTAYCWGSNASGQLGDGTTVGHADPRAVLGPAGVSFASISAGDSHTCAVASNGVGYCWGLNAEGQLGVGNRVGRTVPTAVVP